MCGEPDFAQPRCMNMSGSALKRRVAAAMRSFGKRKDSFGKREGTDGILVDVESPPAACQSVGAVQGAAAECCTMYIRSPSTIIGQSWGTMQQAQQSRWSAINCDVREKVLHAARRCERAAR